MRKHLSQVFLVCGPEERRIAARLFGEAVLSAAGTEIFCEVLMYVQEHEDKFLPILYRCLYFWSTELVYQNLAERGNPKAPGHAGIVNTAFLTEILRELGIEDYHLQGVSVEVPPGPFDATTLWGHVYHVGAAGADGTRLAVSRTFPCLQTGRLCKVEKLVLGEEMTLWLFEQPESFVIQAGGLEKVRVQSICTASIVSVQTGVAW